MNKAVIIILILLLVMVFTGTGHCDGPIKKLGRGVWNGITWPLELPNRIRETNRRSGAMDAATYGVLEGVCMMVGRACAGFWEIVTFPFPVPEGYQPILKDPEYFSLGKPKQ